MIKQTDKVTTNFSNKIIVKFIYNFITIQYNELKIISIELINDSLNIYLERTLSNQYKDIIALQKALSKYINENFKVHFNDINIIKM